MFDGLKIKRVKTQGFRRFWWAQQGSNLRPLPCEGNALPLSYAPDRSRFPYKLLLLSRQGVFILFFQIGRAKGKK